MRRPWSFWTKATRSRRRPEAATVVLLLFALGACAPTAPKGVAKDKLDAAVSDAIGDPASCVLMAEQASGKVVYRYNTATVCARELPACDSPTERQVKDLLEATRADGKPRQLSCDETPDHSKGVSWASGVLPRKGLVYAAVMEGDRTFPGMMMAERLEPRFKDLGLD